MITLTVLTFAYVNMIVRSDADDSMRERAGGAEEREGEREKGTRGK